MPDPGFVSLADSLGSFSSVVFFIFLGAAFLIAWQFLIILGALISNLRHREHHEEAGSPKVA